MHLVKGSYYTQSIMINHVNIEHEVDLLHSVICSSGTKLQNKHVVLIHFLLSHAVANISSCTTVYLQQRKHVMIPIFVFAVQKTLITILDL